MTYADIIARHNARTHLDSSQWSPSEAAHVASHYLHYRKGNRRPAVAALELAKALPASYVAGRGYYGPAGAWGPEFERNGDRLRYVENWQAAGLRFVDWADKLPGGPDHTGWFTYPDGEPGDMLRGAVWQLPGHGGRVRLLYGYCELEGRDRETNPGSALINVGDVITSDPVGDCDSVRDLDEIRDAARWADGLAESMAEDERDYRAAYAHGERAAELDNAALELRMRARALAGAAKAHRRSGVGPVMESALCRTLADILRTISAKREERDNAWTDCPSYQADAWRAGFMDMSEGGFVRAVRLGYASRADWHGPADACPLDREKTADLCGAVAGNAETA